MNTLKHLVLGSLVIDLELRAVGALGGMSSGLSSSADELLLLLCDHANTVVSRETILNVVWSGAVVEDAAITNCIWQIRKAIGDHDKQLLQTRMKRGYVLYVPASAWRAAPQPPTAATVAATTVTEPAAVAQDVRAASDVDTPPPTSPVAPLPAAAPTAPEPQTIAAPSRRRYWIAGFAAACVALFFIAGAWQRRATPAAPSPNAGPRLSLGTQTPVRLTIVTQDEYDTLRVDLAQRIALEAYLRGAGGVSTYQAFDPYGAAAATALSTADPIDVRVETRPSRAGRIDASIRIAQRDTVRSRRFDAAPAEATRLLGDYFARQLPQPRRARTPAVEAFAQGVVRQQRLEVDAALGHYRRAVALDPNLFEARLALARIDLAQGRWRSAITAIERLAERRDIEPAQRCALNRVMLDIAPEHLRDRARHEVRQACAGN